MSKHPRDKQTKPLDDADKEVTSTEVEELTEDVLVEEVKEPAPTPTPDPVPEPVQVVVNQTKNLQAPPPMNDLIVFLDQYRTKLVDLKDDKEVAKLQVSFFKKIMSVLSKESFEEARTGLNTILKYIYQHRSAGLNELNLFRGAAHWEESPEDYSVFRRLLWVFLETCNPQTRKSVGANVNLTALEKNLTITQYSNLISFYS